MRGHRRSLAVVAVLAIIVAFVAACAQRQQPRTTSRDKTKRGAAVGAAAGAIVGAILGEGEADDILKGAAIGAGLGAGVGAYMDRQEEKIARIPGTTVERVSENRILVHFNSDVLFAVDSADLNANSRIALNEAAKVIVEFDKTAVIVQGHTDSTGTNEHNLDLSQRRADSVRAYLSDRGVSAARMKSRGYGEDHPVATNDTTEGRQANRRVDLLLKARAK